MVRSVNRQYLIQLVEQCYIDQENNFFFCGDYNCKFCKESKNVEEKLRKKINALNSEVVNWKVTYYKNDPTVLAIFPVHE